MALLFGFGAMTTAAQGPTPASPPQTPAAAPPAGAAGINLDDPAKAATFGNIASPIAPDTAMWFQFNYTGGGDSPHDLVSIRLVNGTDSGIDMQIWSPERLQGGWWNNQPVGKGTAQTVVCDTGEIAGNGGCQSPDLTWSGAFSADGIYYVRLFNNNPFPVTPQLIIGGPGLADCIGAAPGTIMGQSGQNVDQIQC